MKHTKKEIAQIQSDHEWWSEFGSLLGWKLYAWTFRRVADFADARNITVSITGRQREDILDAIRRAALANGGGE